MSITTNRMSYAFAERLGASGYRVADVVDRRLNDVIPVSIGFNAIILDPPMQTVPPILGDAAFINQAGDGDE